MSLQDLLNAGVVLQSDLDKDFIDEATINKYLKSSNKYLIKALEGGTQFFFEDFHTYIYHQKGLRDLDINNGEFEFRNGIVGLHNNVIRYILNERNKGAGK